jgi:hypothetical protein
MAGGSGSTIKKEDASAEENKVFNQTYLLFYFSLMSINNQ